MNITEKIICPIEGQFHNQEFELLTIFDISSINGAVNHKISDVQQVLRYVLNHQNTNQVTLMDNFIRRNLNQDCYNMYLLILNNYNIEENQFRRYWYVEDDKFICNMFDTYNNIFNIIKQLETIVINENRRQALSSSNLQQK